MRRLTEKRAYLAAKQLAHYREMLPWMCERMEENERLLRERLEESGDSSLPVATPLRLPRTAGVVVGQLPAPASRFEQLELYVIHAVEVAHEGRRSR